MVGKKKYIYRTIVSFLKNFNIIIIYKMSDIVSSDGLHFLNYKNSFFWIDSSKTGKIRVFFFLNEHSFVVSNLKIFYLKNFISFFIIFRMSVRECRSIYKWKRSLGEKQKKKEKN